MKAIYKALEKQSVKLRELIQQREDTFYDRSEKWQESEKGEEYEYKTLDIESCADDLDGVLHDLQELL